MQVKDWLPLVGVVVGAVLGWVLTQLTQWMLVRRDEKKAIARALSDLLEIRHSLLAVSKAVEFLSSHLSMPRELQTPMKVVLTQLLPAESDLPKRYAESVTLVAASNPLLGFRLRSQDAASPLLHRLRAIAISDTGPSSAAILANLEPELLKHLNQHFECLIKELGWMHGWITWWRVGRQLKRPFEVPDALLDSLKAGLPSTPRQLSTEQDEPSDGP
jgi:hypothetical protein